MDSINNNQFEVIPNSKSKRKIRTPCANAYLNPALNLLANEDPMCNTALEIVPVKKRRRTKSCEIAAFENTALDLGISKAAINEFLTRELENVKKTMKPSNSLTFEENNANNSPNACNKVNEIEPVYSNIMEVTNSHTDSTTLSSCYDANHENIMELSNIDPNTSEIEMDSGISIMEQKPLSSTQNHGSNNSETSAFNNITNIQTNVTNQILINNTSNLNLSFIDRLALDSPQLDNPSLCLDDDLNESNIMEIKTITIITKKKRVPEKKRNTNPFLDPNLDENMCMDTTVNPFLSNDAKPVIEYNVDALNRPVNVVQPQVSSLMPRRLFSGDTINSTISTVNESSINIESQNEYENIDNYRSDSPIYENVSSEDVNELYYNKQSKILGYDVSHFSAIDIMNLNKMKDQTNSSNESTDSKKDLKQRILKASKLSKKVFNKIKKTFKTEKLDQNSTLNPYEVPRKAPKQKVIKHEESGIENPGLNLNNSDEIEIEELEEEDDDEEHQYETIKTLRNTRLNTNLTPLRERFIDNTDTSQNKTMTPGKKVRFDSTLNREKVITGNSFDYGVTSPGFDEKIDKYHDELENDINERKYLQQNM